MEKIILIDKPVDWTSFDVVAKVRALIKHKTLNIKHANGQQPIANSTRTKVRVGHAGTLDPFATGLLIVLVGDATKKQAEFMKLDKTYEATLKLGFTSSTGDPEGEITQYVISTKAEKSRTRSFDSHSLTQDDIESVLSKFTGKITQTPPQYSAIKVEGKPAYKYAREGKSVELKPRTVNIYQVTITNYQYPKLEIKVKCSSGTYVRTLAEDIGKELGTGAYLTALRRTKIGPHDTKDARSILSFNSSSLRSQF